MGIRASSSAKGLGLATIFFRSRLVTIAPRIRDKAAAQPVFLVFGITRRTTAQRIQNHPPFPRNVTDFINGVSISDLKCCWIWRRISPSSCCIDCKIFIYILLIRRISQSALPAAHSPVAARQFIWSDQHSPLSLFFITLFSADSAAFFYISASVTVCFTFYILYCIFLDLLITKAKYFIN